MPTYQIFDVTPVHDPSYLRIDHRFSNFNDFMREIAILVRDGVSIYDAHAYDDGTLIVNVCCPSDMTGGE